MFERGGTGHTLTERLHGTNKQANVVVVVVDDVSSSLGNGYILDIKLLHS